MYPIDPRSRSAWWDANTDIIMAFDALHRAVDRLGSTGESKCDGLKVILAVFASEMMRIVHKHGESSKIKDEIDSLLQDILKKRDEFKNKKDESDKDEEDL